MIKKRTRQAGKSATCALWLLILPAGVSKAELRPPGGRAANSSTSPLARQMLAAHNTVRARLKLPPLQWSDQLAMHAQGWASTLLARRQFFHRPNSIFGENLFVVKNGRITASEVVSDWASESRNYSYRTNSCRGMCAHYTQIVWRNTQRVGCGVARGGGNEIWACNYDPPGNVLGERPF